MIPKVFCQGLNDLVTKMYLVADNLSLIDIEPPYSDEMRYVCKKMGQITEAIPLLARNVRKPLTDVVKTDEAIIVTVELPGMEKEDIEVTATDDELSVRAKKTAEPKMHDVSVHECERSHGIYRRKIKLPCSIKRDETGATLNNGLLTITIPKEVVTARTRIRVD
jgi:HSP20 family molecular chaperone IbpA